MKFNEESRQKNALLASTAGLVEQVCSIVSVFVFRTIFLSVLSKEYLGIEGLFTNILQLFSLAELGIGNAVIFRMYKPFAEKDVNGIAAYTRFYKNVYCGIAIFIGLMGACLFPFIEKIVNASEVPSDVNLQLVYVLFVLQSIASYCFVYKQAVVSADQKGYIVSVLNTVVNIVKVVVKIIILIVTREYELVLFGGIVATIVINWFFSLWISKQYKEIFRNNSRLTKEQRQDIIKDTTALMTHKVGYVVLTSTDNIVLTKMVSLAAVGIYANYSTIVTAVSNLLGRLMNSFIPTIGNFILQHEKKEVEQLYKKLLFVNMWFASLCTICLYVLLNPFIEVWLDESFLLTKFTVIIICLQFYVKACQIISNAFINGAGLFNRDRIRPLIESVINLVVSIVLAKEIGIAGVFIGTCVSSLLTSYWREPYLLYKNVFESNGKDFIKTQIVWLLTTCVVCFITGYVCNILPISILGIIIRMAICGVGVNALYVLLWYRTAEFQYFFDIIKDKASVIIRRK